MGAIGRFSGRHIFVELSRCGGGLNFPESLIDPPGQISLADQIRSPLLDASCFQHFRKACPLPLHPGEHVVEGKIAGRARRIEAFIEFHAAAEGGPGEIPQSWRRSRTSGRLVALSVPSLPVRNMQSQSIQSGGQVYLATQSAFRSRVWRKIENVFFDTRRGANQLKPFGINIYVAR